MISIENALTRDEFDNYKYYHLVIPEINLDKY